MSSSPAEIHRASADPISSPGDGKGERPRLRCAAEVTVVESADQRQRNDEAVFGWLDGARLGRVFPERQVRTRAVIVVEVAAQPTTKVTLIQDDHVVEELAADCADYALDERVLPWRTWRGQNLDDANSFYSFPELLAVSAIAIAQEVARR